MKIYLMTDMEGVAGVVSFGEWTGPGKPYYPVARALLTEEVNAVAQGLFMGGATGGYDTLRRAPQPESPRLAAGERVGSARPARAGTASGT